MTLPAIRRIAAGGIIRSDWLNRIVDQVNENTQAFRRPTQLNQGTLPIRGDDGEPVVPTPSAPDVWVENNRTTSTVRVTNPEDEMQYVDVERIETICFQTPEGEVQLVFKNTDT